MQHYQCVDLFFYVPVGMEIWRIDLSYPWGGEGVFLVINNFWIGAFNYVQGEWRYSQHNEPHLLREEILLLTTLMDDWIALVNSCQSMHINSTAAYGDTTLQLDMAILNKRKGIEVFIDKKPIGRIFKVCGAWHGEGELTTTDASILGNMVDEWIGKKDNLAAWDLF